MLWSQTIICIENSDAQEACESSTEQLLAIETAKYVTSCLNLSAAGSCRAEACQITSYILLTSMENDRQRTSILRRHFRRVDSTCDWCTVTQRHLLIDFFDPRRTTKMIGHTCPALRKKLPYCINIGKLVEFADWADGLKSLACLVSLVLQYLLDIYGLLPILGRSRNMSANP
jgi:hypothetical protein